MEQVSHPHLWNEANDLLQATVLCREHTRSTVRSLKKQKGAGTLPAPSPLPVPRLIRRDGHALVLSSTARFSLRLAHPLLMGSPFPPLALYRTRHRRARLPISRLPLGKIAADKRARVRPSGNTCVPVATPAYHPATSPTLCSSSNTFNRCRAR
jgi:hypothetical protein